MAEKCCDTHASGVVMDGSCGFCGSASKSTSANSRADVPSGGCHVSKLPSQRQVLTSQPPALLIIA